MESRKRWNVYSIRKREGMSRSFWMKVGVGFVNADGSINLYLDATPLDGKLQLREWSEDETRGSGASEGRGATSGAPAEAAAQAEAV